MLWFFANRKLCIKWSVNHSSVWSPKIIEDCCPYGIFSLVFKIFSKLKGFLDWNVTYLNLETYVHVLSMTCFNLIYGTKPAKALLK